MFRFSIRDLMLLAAIVGMAIAWTVEHSRVSAERSRLRTALAETVRAKAEVSAANKELAAASEAVSAMSERSREESEVLERHGLTLYPFGVPICAPPDFPYDKLPKMPMLFRLCPDGTYSEIKTGEPVEQSPCQNVSP